jgi:lipoprotein-releasing system ATP-binding protein
MLGVNLTVSDLHKTFEGGTRQIKVLRGVSLMMERGDSLAITGPSGSGKSTLLHCLGTLTPPTEGTVQIGGTDPFLLPEPELARLRNDVIGFVFQDHHLLPQYTVLENVWMPALAFPEKSEKAESRANQLLERVGLGHRLDHRPGSLSGGERQRVAVARALLNSPSLLLCDEPTGNLDASTADKIAELLFELHRDERTILIVVTHSLGLAERFQTQREIRGGRLSEVA